MLFCYLNFWCFLLLVLNKHKDTYSLALLVVSVDGDGH